MATHVFSSFAFFSNFKGHCVLKLPVTCCRGPEFVKLAKLVRPGVKVACRKELSKHFVPELSKGEVKGFKHLVQGPPSLHVFGYL